MTMEEGMMNASAPWFMVPAEIMKKIEEKMAKTSISDAPMSDAPVPEAAKEAVDNEKSSARDFLSVLHAGMPVGGAGQSGPTRFQGGYQMGLTENAAATYLSSGSRCLDFFFQVVPSTPQEDVERLITMAWQEDALKALKLIFHLRGVRGTGKSDKERFYHAALWLHEHHPATLRANVASVAAFGYFKDLLELTLRLVQGPAEVRKKAEEKAQHKSGKGSGFIGRHVGIGNRSRSSSLHSYGMGSKRRETSKTASRSAKSREERIADAQERDRQVKRQAAAQRREDAAEKARKVYVKFHRDSRFQALYVEVAKVFAERLQADCKALKENRLSDISLAGKWAPSLDSSYDKQTMLCYAIARQMFPKEDVNEYANLGDNEYAYVVRERLRREVLTPLRKVLQLPEVYMSAQKWGDVNYRRVASVAMRNYKKHFLKHDEQRFNQFLQDVEAGKEKVAAGALYPHEIVEAAMSSDRAQAKVADLQWQRMVDDLKKLGTLSNCIAVCDVSGSMAGEPMNVCIALGILLSELSEEPWKGNVITFSHRPEIHQIKGDTLMDKAEFVKRMQWNMNTNLQLVFDRILTMAKAENLAPEKMIKRLFIFSDMEFDKACSRSWETDYDAIVRKFKKERFGKPPEIVFWNLRHSSSIPVIESEPGVGLVSGFSKNMVKIFLEKDGEINPTFIMDTAIAGEEYAVLKVVD